MHPRHKQFFAFLRRFIPNLRVFIASASRKQKFRVSPSTWNLKNGGEPSSGPPWNFFFLHPWQRMTSSFSNPGGKCPCPFPTGARASPRLVADPRIETLPSAIATFCRRSEAGVGDMIHSCENNFTAARTNNTLIDSCRMLCV